MTAAKLTFLTVVLVLVGSHSLPAQDDYEPGPDGKFNSNIAFTITSPVNPMAKYSTPGWGFVYGAGYNLNRHHSLVGELMWNRLYPTTQALQPIRNALQLDNLNGNGDLLAITGNYRLQFQGNTLGTYLIGGGGMYYRSVTLSQHVNTGNPTIACTPEWLWSGFSCSSGFVIANQTVGGSSSFAPGWNAGAGIMFKMPDSWWKVYLEARYHYSSSKGIVTRVIPFTIGVRF